MAQINVSNLTFAYDGSYDNIFEDVSLSINTDWRLGFTGRNGRGKTTFLRLLTGGYDYSGTICAPVDFEYFPYELTDETKTAAEMISDITPECAEWEILREISLLGLSDDVLNRPFNTLSNGERTKLLLAALFLRENSFLLIDEPTNHLDMEARALVSRYLRSKKGFILVSHDRAFLDGCIDHVLSLNKTNIEIRRGSFSAWLADKEHQDNLELAQNERLKKEVKRLSAAAARTSSWSEKTEKAKYDTKNSGIKPDRGYVGHKAAKMMKRSKGIESRQQSAIEEKSRLLKNIEDSDSLMLSQLLYHSKTLLSLSGVSITYGEKTACREVTFSVEQGDRIALCGRNGTGKSSVLKLICGEDIEYTGQLQIGSHLDCSYVPQDTSFLSGSLSDYAESRGIDESLFKAILRKLDFSRTQFEKDMRDFSGGQKKKVLIAGSLCDKSHLLVWDEPLNFIDLISRIQLENLLLEYQPTIIFVEHDSAFCDKIATKKVFLH